MTDDIVTRLRNLCVPDDSKWLDSMPTDRLMLKAADEIERLREQRNELAWAIAWFLNGGSRQKLKERFKAYEDSL